MPVDRAPERLVDFPTPSAWADELDTDRVRVLPLVDDLGWTGYPGWCSYSDRMTGSPDFESFCGGINTKTPAAAALWREGHLLHFGFEPSPAELNDTGDALLVNAIAYIARFRQDQALLHVASPFAGGGPRARSSVRTMIKMYDLSVTTTMFDPGALPDDAASSKAALQAWFAENERHLAPSSADSSRLAIDPNVRRLDLDYSDRTMFDACIAALRSGPRDRAEAARAVLERFAPMGPRGDGADAWRDWFEASRPYLFYSEWGGYRWYVDRLAQARGRSTGELVGPDRADR